ncbi:golgin subfamily A member 6-like protein 7 [Nematostella vectensis]|uniref:golgin subfamily A member 6-like protein 7 n=1 Tax=Nematostella vectensis TaxID=45351 RepID=UPI00139003D0|nr:golgin subfamily A member 6-like protein 7 [Nematostella vectensis]
MNHMNTIPWSLGEDGAPATPQPAVWWLQNELQNREMYIMELRKKNYLLEEERQGNHAKISTLEASVNLLRHRNKQEHEEVRRQVTAIEELTVKLKDLQKQNQVKEEEIGQLKKEVVGSKEHADTLANVVEKYENEVTVLQEKIKEFDFKTNEIKRDADERIAKEVKMRKKHMETITSLQKACQTYNTKLREQENEKQANSRTIERQLGQIRNLEVKQKQAADNFDQEKKTQQKLIKEKTAMIEGLQASVLSLENQNKGLEERHGKILAQMRKELTDLEQKFNTEKQNKLQVLEEKEQEMDALKQKLAEQIANKNDLLAVYQQCKKDLEQEREQLIQLFKRANQESALLLKRKVGDYLQPLYTLNQDVRQST